MFNIHGWYTLMLQKSPFLYILYIKHTFTQDLYWQVAQPVRFYCFWGMGSNVCYSHLNDSNWILWKLNLILKYCCSAFHVFGPAGKLAVEVGIIGFLMGTCIAYFVVVGDLGPQIIAKMFNINQSDILR